MQYDATVVLDEIPMRIRDIRFVGGQMWLYATTAAPGTYTVRANAELSLFGSDGTLIFHQPARDGGRVEQSKDGFMSCEVPLRLVPL